MLYQTKYLSVWGQGSATQCLREKKMEAIFQSFCVFGAKDSAPMMDGAKFSKFCRDMNLLDKKLTSTDVDIVFAKAKRYFIL